MMANIKMTGKIVLVPFPFTDLTAAKLRPALVTYEGESDVVLAFISSKRQTKIPDMEVLINKSCIMYHVSSVLHPASCIMYDD